MVDDEPHVLDGYRRTAGRAFDLTCAVGGAAGIGAIAAEPGFAVVITDMRMPEMTGLQFIATARRRAPDAVYMMLTGNADQQTAVDAINQGDIFRFLNKPCPADLLATAIRAGVRQHELVTVERTLLRDTFTGTVKLLADAMELSNPELFAFQGAVRQTYFELLAVMGIPLDWSLVVAGSVCLVGLVTVPGVGRSERFDDDALAAAAAAGGRMLAHVPRLATVSRMIERCRELGALPDPAALAAPDEAAMVGARLLRFSIDLVREASRAADRAAAVAVLKSSGAYDPRIVEAAERLPVTAKAVAARDVPSHLVATEMVVDEDVLRTDGTLVVPAGQQLSELAAAALRHHARIGAIPPTVQIRGQAGA